MAAAGHVHCPPVLLHCHASSDWLASASTSLRSHCRSRLARHSGQKMTCLSSILKGQPCTHALPGGKLVADPGRKPVPGLDGPQREVHHGNLLTGQAPAAAVDEVQPNIRIVPAGIMH